MPFAQTVNVGSAVFTFSADAGVFPNRAALSVEAVEDAAFAEAVEAAIGAEGVYTHRMYRVAAFDADGSGILPDFQRGIPRALAEGLSLPADTRVALYDAREQAIHIIASSADAGAVAFSLAALTVYDIVTIAPPTNAELEEPVQPQDEQDIEALTEERADEPPVEEPAGETSETPDGTDGMESVDEPHHAVVSFDVSPQTAEIMICPVASAEGLTLDPIPQQADGTFLLSPGAYVYTASAAGYASIEEIPLTIGAFDEYVTVFFSLDWLDEAFDSMSAQSAMAPAADLTVIEVDNGFVDSVMLGETAMQVLFHIDSHATFYGQDAVSWLERLAAIEFTLTDGERFRFPMETAIVRGAEIADITVTLGYDAAYDVDRMCERGLDVQNAKIICSGASCVLNSASLNDLLTRFCGVPVDLMPMLRQTAEMVEAAVELGA